MEKKDETKSLHKQEALLQELIQRMHNVEEMQKMILVNDLLDEIENSNVNLVCSKMTDLPDEMQVIVQYDYKDYIADDIVKAVMEKFKSVKPDEKLESLKVYIKPEDRTAYFVANGSEDKRYRVSLYKLRKYMTEIPCDKIKKVTV